MEDGQVEAARYEYSLCQDGIKSYDEHLFKIRSWNIALSGVFVAGLLGITKADGQFIPSLLLFAYTFTSFFFWVLDALNKDLQSIYIECSKDIEKYLRNEDGGLYIGPSISLRFSRKEQGYFVSVVKTLAHHTVLAFYIGPLAAVWLVVCISKQVELSEVLENFPSTAHVQHWLAISSVIFIVFMLGLSFVWRTRPKMDRLSWLNLHIFYVFRANDRRRRRALQRINEALGHEPSKEKMVIGPFSPEYFCNISGKDTLVFIDRRSIAHNHMYVSSRREILTSHGFSVREIAWTRRNTMQSISYAFRPFDIVFGNRENCPNRKLLDDLCIANNCFGKNDSNLQNERQSLIARIATCFRRLGAAEARNPKPKRPPPSGGGR